ncbi:MAG: cobalamin biosynthesis protein CobQ, partial [Angelakisella sp.]
MNDQRITIVCGHYGSGKTNLSVNLALRAAAVYPKTAVADLDIVNPYFRTADFGSLFANHGIELIAPMFANSNLDIPAIPAALRGAIGDVER